MVRRSKVRADVRHGADVRLTRVGGRPAAILAHVDHMNWQQLLAGFGTFGVLLTLAFVFFVRNPIPTPEDNAAAVTAPRGR